MITRYPEETKWSIWRRQANQNSGKPWRNIKGLPFAGPARTTCNEMPFISKMRDSRDEPMFATFITWYETNWGRLGNCSMRSGSVQSVLHIQRVQAPALGSPLKTISPTRQIFSESAAFELW